jgi:hypothetical protein
VDGIQTAFIVAIALACACTILSFGTKWQKLQAASEPREADGAGSGSKTAEADAMV